MALARDCKKLPQTRAGQKRPQHEIAGNPNMTLPLPLDESIVKQNLRKIDQKYKQQVRAEKAAEQRKQVFNKIKTRADAVALVQDLLAQRYGSADDFPIHLLSSETPCEASSDKVVPAPSEANTDEVVPDTCESQTKNKVNGMSLGEVVLNNGFAATIPNSYTILLKSTLSKYKTGRAFAQVLRQYKKRGRARECDKSKKLLCALVAAHPTTSAEIIHHCISVARTTLFETLAESTDDADAGVLFGQLQVEWLQTTTPSPSSLRMWVSTTCRPH